MPPERDRRRDAAWVAALVLLALAAWVWCVLVPASANRPTTHVTVAFEASDLFLYFLPSYAFEARRLAAGELPLWNPFQAAGQPFLATLQPGALYPGRLLLLFFDPPTAMHVGIVAHQLLALVATFALCRRLGASAGGAAAAAVAWFGAFSVPNMYWPSFLEAGTWLPVAAWALAGVPRGGWRPALAFGVAAAMPILAGGYQISLYVAYALVVLLVALAADPRRRGRLLAPATLGRLACAAVLTAGTVAPQMATTLAWTSETTRSTRPLTDLQINPVKNPGTRARQAFMRGAGWQPFYLSLPVAGLALVGVATGGRLAWVAGAASLAAFLLMLGPGTPWFWLYRWVPGFAIFRWPNRLFAPFAFFAVLLAALGVTALARLRPFAGSRRALLVELAAVAAVAGALLGPLRYRTQLPWTVPRAMLGVPAGLEGALRRLTADGRAAMPSDTLDLRVAIRQGMMQGIPVLQDYEPLSSRALGGLLHGVAALPPPTGEEIIPFNGAVPVSRRIVRPWLLDLLAVRALVLPVTTLPPVRRPPYVRAATDAGYQVWENPSAVPRAYLATRARFASDRAAALAMLVDRRADGRTEPVVAATPAPDEAALAGGERRAPVPVRIVVDAPERQVVEFDTAVPALLVVADAWAPGWSATVDGAPRRLHQVNGYVRGVVVRPGERRAELAYRAPGFAAGVAAAAAAWTAVGAVAFATRRRRAGGGAA